MSNNNNKYFYSEKYHIEKYHIDMIKCALQHIQSNTITIKQAQTAEVLFR